MDNLDDWHYEEPPFRWECKGKRKYTRRPVTIRFYCPGFVFAETVRLDLVWHKKTIHVPSGTRANRHWGLLIASDVFQNAAKRCMEGNTFRRLLQKHGSNIDHVRDKVRCLWVKPTGPLVHSGNRPAHYALQALRVGKHCNEPPEGLNIPQQEVVLFLPYHHYRKWWEGASAMLLLSCLQLTAGELCQRVYDEGTKNKTISNTEIVLVSGVSKQSEGTHTPRKTPRERDGSHREREEAASEWWQHVDWHARHHPPYVETVKQKLQTQRAAEDTIVCAGDTVILEHTYVPRSVHRRADHLSREIERQAGYYLDQMGPLTNPLSAAITWEHTLVRLRAHALWISYTAYRINGSSELGRYPGLIAQWNRKSNEVRINRDLAVLPHQIRRALVLEYLAPQWEELGDVPYYCTFCKDERKYRTKREGLAVHNLHGTQKKTMYRCDWCNVNIPETAANKHITGDLHMDAFQTHYDLGKSSTYGSFRCHKCDTLVCDPFGHLSTPDHCRMISVPLHAIEKIRITLQGTQSKRRTRAPKGQGARQRLIKLQRERAALAAKDGRGDLQPEESETESDYYNNGPELESESARIRGHSRQADFPPIWKKWTEARSE